MPSKSAPAQHRQDGHQGDRHQQLQQRETGARDGVAALERVRLEMPPILAMATAIFALEDDDLDTDEERRGQGEDLFVAAELLARPAVVDVAPRCRQIASPPGSPRGRSFRAPLRQRPQPEVLAGRRHRSRGPDRRHERHRRHDGGERHQHLDQREAAGAGHHLTSKVPSPLATMPCDDDRRGSASA
jgi:hypothetical protein